MPCWFPIEEIVLLFLLMGYSGGLERDKFVVQPHPIQFTEEPHNWTVTEGASVSLTCNTTVVTVIGYINADTTPLPTIRWFHNNVMISSSGRYTINNYGIDTSILTIRNVTSLEQGEYYCVVNEWVKPDGDWWTKTRSKSSYVTVISSNTSILTVNIKEHVSLSCVEPTAVAPSNVFWTEDGVKMFENVTVVNGNLIVFEVSEVNSGHYRCIDQANNNTLLHYSLTVNNPSPNEYLQQQQLLIENVSIENRFIQIRHDADIHGCMHSPANQSVILNCKANGHQTIRWYKNGEVLDVNSEGTMFNQTTGDLYIRREDPCELLGVYQCFVSNDIDTVYVSTRVLPFGWPNHPGRPELVHLKSQINKFELVAKLNPPDYLGGLTTDGLLYQVYISDAGGSVTPYFLDEIEASSPLDTVRIQLRKDFLNGLGVLDNVYYIFVILKLVNKGLSHLIALPGPSPILIIDTICTFLVNPPPPVIVETCHYDNISDLVIHNISWHVKTQFEGLYFQLYVEFWNIAGGCTYRNGTIAEQHFNGHNIFSNHHSWKLPKNSVCNVSIFYDDYCGSATSYLTEQCDERDLYETAGPTAVSKAKGDRNMLVVVTVSLATVMVIISICAILCLCYREQTTTGKLTEEKMTNPHFISFDELNVEKYSHHEESALRMLNTVKEINQLQATCPISIDHQSLDGLCTKSELYVEKVNRWMEYISEEPLDDIDSVMEGCSLGTSEMLDQIVEGKSTHNVNNFTPSLSHYIHEESAELSNATKLISLSNIKKRLQSDDSGLESEGNSPYIREINSELFQKCYLTTMGRVTQATVLGHDQLSKSYMELECDRLKGTSYCGSNSIGLSRPAVNNTSDCHQDDMCSVNTAEQFGGYVGLEVVDESLCVLRSAERFDEQIEVEEVSQDHHLSKSIVKTDEVDQTHYLPKSTENSDYVGLDQHQCLPKPTEIFDYVGLEMVDRNHYLPNQVETLNGRPDNEDNEPTDKFNYAGLALADQNQNHSHLPLQPNKCIPMSTETFAEYIKAETHSMHKSKETFDELKVTDQCTCKSAVDCVDHIDVEMIYQDDITHKNVKDMSDQHHRPILSGYYMYSDGSKVISKCCHQGVHEDLVSSSSSHDGISNDDVITGSHEKQHYIQFNDDGYVTSTVFIGQ